MPDDSWGVIIGAAIAVLGSVLAPWVTGRIDTARAQRIATREQLRIAIADYLELAVLAYDRELGVEDRRRANNRASVAASRVSLLLDSSDVVIEQIGDEALQPVVLRPPGDPEGPIRLSAYQQIMHEWFRGELPTSRVRETYDARVAALRAEHPLFSKTDSPVVDPLASP